MNLAIAPLGAAILSTVATAQQGFTLINMPVGANPHQVAVANLDQVGTRDVLIETTSPSGIFHARIIGGMGQDGVPPLAYLIGDGGPIGPPPPPPPPKPTITYEIECDGKRITVRRGPDGNLQYGWPITDPWTGGVSYIGMIIQPWHVFDTSNNPFVIGPDDEWSLIDVDGDGDIDKLVVYLASGEVRQFANGCGTFIENAFTAEDDDINHTVFKLIVGGGDDDAGKGNGSGKKKLLAFESNATTFGVLVSEHVASGAMKVTSTIPTTFPVGVGMHYDIAGIAALASRTTTQIAYLEMPPAGGPVLSYFTIPYMATSIAIADLNGDSVLDLVVANETTGAVGVQLRGASPSFVSLGSVAGPRSILATDLDQDGDVDLVTSNGGDQSATIWIQGTIPTIPGATAYGAGTPGCSGYESIGLSAAPKIGTAFSVLGARAPLTAPGLLLFGTAPDVQGNDILGVDAILHIDLMSSFELHSFTIMSDALGNAQLPLALPNVPGLVGANFYGQLIWFWTNPNCGILPTTLSTFGLSTSRGLQLTIQP